MVVRVVRHRIDIAAATFSPADLTGLTAWYDASDAGSITESGGAVSQWNDLSGNGYHLTQSTGANKPTTGTNTINGLNVLTSAGSAFMSRAATQIVNSSTGEWSVFVVARVTALVGTQQIIDQDDATRVAQFVRVNGSNLESIAFTTASTDTPGSSPSATVAFQASAIRTTTTVEAFLDGSGNGSTSATSPETGATVLTVFRGGTNAGTNQLTGDIAEIIVTNTDSSADRTTVESYLQAKWGTP